MANEQIGNESYRTMTPGSAMAGQLQNILASRRAEKRQAMLDELERQKVESAIAAQTENARSLAEDRASRAEDRLSSAAAREAQEDIRRGSMLTPDQPLVGTDLEYWKKRAPSMVLPGQLGTEPLGPEEVGPTMPAVPERFRGMPAQLETQRKTKLQEELLRRMQDVGSGWETLPDAAKYAQHMQAFGTGLPENVQRPNVGGKVLFADEATKTLTDAEGKRVTSAGPNDKIVDVSRPPQPSAATIPNYIDLGPEIDAEGKPTGNRIQVNSKTGDYKVTAMRIGAKTPPAHKPITFAAADTNKLATLNAKATAAGGWFSPTITEGDRAAYKQLSEVFISKYAPNDEVKKAVRAMMKTQTPVDPQTGEITTVAELVEGLQSEGLLKPEDVGSFTDIMSILWSK